MLSIVTTEFEQYKQDVLDNHKKEREEFREFLEKTEKERREGEKEKEREEGLLKEIEELRQTILGGEKVR
jgi:cell shape-determining protein MreC